MNMKNTAIKSRISATVALFVALIVLTAAAAPHLLKFESESFDFGTISESSPAVKHDYKFVNTGSEPVAVISVSAGCGCTKTIYPTKPVAPGQSAAISITFNPKGQVGSVNKDIKVRYRGAKASSSRRLTLRLRGTVTPG